MTSTSHTITPLRQRMIDDMRMRKLSPKTQNCYIRLVLRFACFLGRSPDTASVEDLHRFLLHILPRGFHRIRHYGLIANPGRRDHLAQVRELLQVVPEPEATQAEAPEKLTQPTFVCPDCGAAMIIVEILARKPLIRAPPPQGGTP